MACFNHFLPTDASYTYGWENYVCSGNVVCSDSNDFPEPCAGRLEKNVSAQLFLWVFLPNPRPKGPFEVKATRKKKKDRDSSCSDSSKLAARDLLVAKAPVVYCRHTLTSFFHQLTKICFAFVQEFHRRHTLTSFFHKLTKICFAFVQEFLLSKSVVYMSRYCLC